MKNVLWIDDVRLAPENTTEITYHTAKSVYEAISILLWHEYCYAAIDYIDIDHDAGDFVSQGGDFIKFLDFLECTGRSYPIRIHSMNPVGVENMRRIIQRNGWTEVR